MGLAAESWVIVIRKTCPSSANQALGYVIGSEANAEYNEKGNGITGPLRGNQLPEGIDPYVVKGDASSGLLPGVNPDMGGNAGDGDHRLQAYCTGWF